MADFARVRLIDVIDGIGGGSPVDLAARAEEVVSPDWDDFGRLEASGLTPDDVTPESRNGKTYLHVDLAAASLVARRAFLEMSGLSDKQKRDIFPALYSSSLSVDPDQLSAEVSKLNSHMMWLRANGANVELFPTYHRALAVHGRTQNTSGAVGAMGAALTFIDAIEECDRHAIVDVVGSPPPRSASGRLANPEGIYRWMKAKPRSTIKALLLRNGRALVFSSSKDANIFMSLGAAYPTANAALSAYTAVRNDQASRHQVLHEFAVGEVKTATDPANLHERLGLASRETQTELRTDRFLMMALLTPELLQGGVAGRVMNNRDLVRFSHVYNLHHCWGWDGGRERHPQHWKTFIKQVAVWCGLDAPC